MLWEAIRNLKSCRHLAMPEPYPGVLYFEPLATTGRGFCWLVGSYRDLRSIATDLRYSDGLQATIAGANVGFGLRNSDIPPAHVAAQERYGATRRGPHAATDFRSQRTSGLAKPVRADGVESINRKSDRELNVASYWKTQTPQAHHIVEFNNLETLGASRASGEREMDYQQLPAVLLMAEFHQRYISSILKPAHRMDAAKLRRDIWDVYRNIYQRQHPMLKPLWDISELILTQLDR